MHEKERVIAPILQDAFQLSCSVPKLNTDLLGTFTGEVKRIDSALITARKKCHLAMDISKCDLAIASEGSFGMHPNIPFAPANEELVLLVDKRHHFELIGKHLTTATNFAGELVCSFSEAMAFAERAGFPSHGLIIRENGKESDCLEKGIVDPQLLIQVVCAALNKRDHVWIETDMRAMFNPTRMKAIEQATLNLVEKLTSYCPKCGTPGFWITDYRAGLPCSWCHQPTESTLATIWGCTACSYSEEKKFPHQKYEEDPMYCGFCNP